MPSLEWRVRDLPRRFYPARSPPLTAPTDRRMPTILGCSAGLALILGVFEYTGGRFDGYYNRREEDDEQQAEVARGDDGRPRQRGQGYVEVPFSFIMGPSKLTCLRHPPSWLRGEEA